MYEYYFTFRSMTLAQQASFQLSTNGITGIFLRAPKAISSAGCGYAVRVSQQDVSAAAAIFRGTGLRFERIVGMDHTGHAKEVYR